MKIDQLITKQALDSSSDDPDDSDGKELFMNIQVKSYKKWFWMNSRLDEILDELEG